MEWVDYYVLQPPPPMEKSLAKKFEELAFNKEELI